jgi:hypothetical protein
MDILWLFNTVLSQIFIDWTFLISVLAVVSLGSTIIVYFLKKL